MGLFILLLVASEVGAAASVLISLVVILQYLTGVVFRASISDSARTQTWCDRVVSFAIGVLLTACAHLLFFGSVVGLIGWILPLFIFGVVALARGVRLRPSSESESEWLYATGVIVAITLLVLGRTYRWQLPLGIALFLATLLAASWKRLRLLLRGGVATRIVGIGFVVASSLVGVWHLAHRSQYWWTLNSDITFTEAVAQSLARWGFIDHAAAIGHSDLGTYHWLPFVWTGLTDVVSGAEAWWISTRVAHVVFVFASVAGIWGFLRENLTATRLMTAFATLVASMVGLFVGANFSGMVGAFWVIAITWYWSRMVNHDHGVSEVIVLTLLAVGLLLSKPQFGVPLLVSFVLLDGWSTVRTSKDRIHAPLRIASVVVAVGLVGVLQRYLAGSNVAASGVIELDLVSLGSFGELGNARNIFALPLAIVAISTTLSLALALWLLVFEQGFTKALNQLIAIVILLSTVALFITDAMFQLLGGYLIGLIILLSGLLAGLAVPALADFFKAKGQRLAIVALLAPISYALVQKWPSLFSPNPTGSMVDMALRTVSEAKWIPMALLAFLGTIVLHRARKDSVSRVEWLKTGCVILIVLTLNPIGIAYRTSEILADTQAVDESLPTGVVALDNQTNELVAYVASNSQVNDLFASNVFCAYDVATLCGNAEWWSDFVKALQTVHVPERCYNLLIYSNDWSLPGVLERRFLIQGPQMFTGCGESPMWLTDRVKQSESFGRLATKESFDYLCSQGVQWFIADGDLAQVTSWEPFGKEVLTTGRLVLIKLDQSLCV